MSQPDPPPVPGLAFSQEGGALLNGELSKGFITAKKQKEAHLFRRSSHSSISEHFTFNSSSPSAVGVLVGSRENIERWLKESGPGSSCIWAETADFSQNAWGKVPSRQLRLIYRLHSEKSFTCVPVLNGTFVEISPQIGALRRRDGGGSLRKVHNVKKKVGVGELKCFSSMLQPEVRSSSDVGSNSIGDLSPIIIGTSVGGGLGENENYVGLVVPEKAYSQLVLMVSSGGIIREYQEFLKRCVSSSNFLDLNFQLLDLQKWLKQHPFAVFLKESDILVVRRGDGLCSLRWIVLRFDLGEGLVKFTTGEDLDDLELAFGNKGTSSQAFGIRLSWWGQNTVSYGDKAQEKEFEKNANNLDWKIWRVAVENKEAHGGTLIRLLLDAFGSEDSLSVTATASLKSLFGSPARLGYHSPPASDDIETVSAPGRSSKGMSWKEQCALSHLRSSSEELKGRGLDVLLNLLLGLGSKKSVHPNRNTSCCGAVAGLDAGLLEEGSRDGWLQDDIQAQHGVEPLHIMDWLDCGFLEVLLERTIFRSGDSKVEGMEIGDVLNMDVALEACLRVLELVPKEGSSQLAKLLVVSVRETCEDFTKLNINLKLNVPKRRTEGRQSVQPNTKHTIPSLQNMVEKVLRFCKLLSLLASQSPLLGGPFAEAGGLDLILDLYFCLVKRFPINLRFGVLSNATGVCQSLEEVLPGEILKSQNTPLKVLPCILSRAFISGVAQACLMDHCMTPKTEKVDFAWPPTSDWKLLYPFKHVPIHNQSDAKERSTYGSSHEEKSGLTHDFYLKPEIPEAVDSYKPYQLAQTSVLSNGCSSSSNRASTVECGCSSSVPINHNSGDGSQAKGISEFHKPKQERPFVPRLPLSSLRRTTSRFGPSIGEPKESGALQTPSVEPSLCHVLSNTGPSISKFDILNSVSDVKVELLQTLNCLLSNSSQSLRLSRKKLLQKFQKEDEDYLALQFLPDIVSSFLKIVPDNISRRTKKMVLEVISLLERGKKPVGKKRTSSSLGRRIDGALVMACNIGQGLPVSGSKRLVDSLLLHISERLRTLLCHLGNMLAISQSLKEEANNNSKKLCVTIEALEDCDPLLKNRAISSGHLLNLWVDVGLLVRALVDFLVLWPEGDSVQCVFNSCRKEIASVLDILAEHSRKSNWSLAQILTMEHLLKLLTVCMKSFAVEKRPEFQTWSEFDTFFWQLLFVDDLHWNCVKNFTTWIVMKSCQGCFKKLFEGYQKVLWEPLEIYYSMLGERINCKSRPDALECTLHGVETVRSIFSFLRVSILMMKKRLKCQNQSCPALLMERLLFLLDFLMNPVGGILMNVIRSPIPCIKPNNLESEALNFLNSANTLQSLRECHVSSSRDDMMLDTNLYSNRMQETCRKCPSTPCAASCAYKLTSYFKKESLGILADIFSLKALDHQDELHSINPRNQNPFLFRKYVHPFLEIVFFYFLKYYNKNIESSESSAISPWTQRASGHSITPINSGRAFRGCTLTKDGSSTHDTRSLNRNDEDGVLCSGCSQDDKVSSVACLTYGQVLRALAQNQTEDVNQSFQQVRVMKFLVQQIGLEYEISQVATPRDVALAGGGMTAEISLQQLQCLDSQEYEAGTSIAGLLWTGERSKAVFPHKSEQIVLPKELVSNLGGQSQKIETVSTAENLALVAKERPTSLSYSLESRTSLDHEELVLNRVLPLGGQTDLIILKKGSSNELEVSTTLVFSKQEVLEKSSRIAEENEVNDFRSSRERAVESPTGQESGQRRGDDAGAILTEVRYTGRFFDLNEEVERELAEEGFSHSQISSQESDETAQTTCLDRLDDIQEESNLQDSSPKLIALDQIVSTNGTSEKCSGEEKLSSKLEPGIISKVRPSLPVIPRLNLSKSVRKGGPAIKSDTTADFEFLPSTTSTPDDSKYRQNAIHELQRELQKEVFSSSRGGKSWETGATYETGCLQRRLYRHAGLHVLLLELFVSLMLTPQGTLETSYSDRFPMENRKLNAPFFLSYHLNHVANVFLLPSLSKRMNDFKPAAFRILKLTWRALFNPRIYTNRIHIARGAASQVYTAKVKQTCSNPAGVIEQLVVLKIVDVPKGPHDPCKFFDVYSEVEILEKFLGEPAICQILDYGVDTESFILVLKHYKCSLYTWRQEQRTNSGSDTFSPTEIQRAGAVPKFVLDRLPVYLEVYSAILQAVKKLEIENVVHYDLKCDNILLEPLDSWGLESEFWSPKWPPTDASKPLPFRICIADFGQSKASTHLGGECTVRNRGTEYVKSPEMLKLLSGQSQKDSDFNLRTIDEGVGKAVDVWSLGCLLYELLTGEYLFYDEDWLQFFMRVTLPSEELISKAKAAKLENYGPVVDLLKFILVRDPVQRPSLDEVTICVEQLQLKLESQALATTCSEIEVPTGFEMLSENSSDTDASNFEGQFFSSEICDVQERLDQKCQVLEHTSANRLKPKRQMECLECLRGLICHCQCGGE